jgi:gamma-aminobutyric acid type B receptor
MRGFGDQNATAVVPVMGAAMRSGGWRDFVDDYRHTGMKFVSGDAMPNQLEALDRGYAHGLVGQLPYEMGYQAIDILNNLIDGEPESEYPEIIGTNVLTHILVPLVLPPLNVDHNLIGNLHVVGYILCGIVSLCSAFLVVWILRHRKLSVVKAAQPGFLLMIILGVFLMGAAMIPLSFDDNGNPQDLSENDGSVICMAIPWTACLGFVTTFSALFAKTRRVNKIFHSAENFRRITVSQREVLIPFLVLFTLNVALLSLWTIIDPLTYVREDLAGTDGWNRVIATYGSCQSENVLPFLLPLAVVNIGILVFANWEAYEARNIMTEFSEAKYIAMAMASLLQATLSGVPILFVVRESPQAYYLVLVFMVFIVCIAVLLLIFVPKVIMAEEFSRQTPRQQTQTMRASIERSTGRGLRRGYGNSSDIDSGYDDSAAFYSTDEGALQEVRETVSEVYKRTASNHDRTTNNLEKVPEEGAPDNSA